MSCCAATYQTFGGVESTTIIPYSGPAPDVEVWYFVDGVLKNSPTNILISPTEIVVDHGGPAVGVIKLIQA